MAVDCLIVFFNGIPFIDCNDDTLSTLMSDSCDFCILFGHTLGRIDHNDTHIGALHCRHGTDDTVTLDFFLDLILTAQSCCIDKHIFLSVVPDIRIDCITGRTCNIGHDHAVLLCQFIDQG